jgi:glycosyltransferase involved in cell wall biosynthesis
VVRADLVSDLRQADAVVVHSEFDRELVLNAYDVRTKEIAVIPHGPYDQYTERAESRTATKTAEDVRLLYFGVIRPFKGVEDLVRAFNLLPNTEASSYRLTIVGEVWEGWRLPLELAAASPRKDQINVIDRYVRDDEVASFFREASARLSRSS